MPHIFSPEGFDTECYGGVNERSANYFCVNTDWSSSSSDIDIFLCKSGLHLFFDFPRDTRKIWLRASTRPTKNSWRFEFAPDCQMRICIPDAPVEAAAWREGRFVYRGARKFLQEALSLNMPYISLYYEVPNVD